MKFFKKRVRLDIAKYSLRNRVCDQWNKLPAEIFASLGINTLKSKLEIYIYLRNIREFK